MRIRRDDDDEGARPTVAAKNQSGSNRQVPPRREKTPMSVQIARGSWQLVIIALIAIGLLIGAKAFPANLVSNAALGVVMVAAIGFAVYALRQVEDDEDNAPRLKRNALYGFLAVAVLVGVTIWNNVRALNARHAEQLAAKYATTPTPVAQVTPVAAASGTARVEDGATAAPAPAATPISAEEARQFARSYLALVKRGLFDEAYRYLPVNVQTRVSARQHADHWSAVAPADKLEELELVAPAAEEAPLDPGKSIEFRVQLPQGSPRVLLVTSSAGKMSAAPFELAKK